MAGTLRRAWGILWLLLAAAAPCAAHAANYDYDQLGRLVRSIDSQGRVTEYVYDPAGNLLQVIQGGAATAPAVTSITPGAIRRNQALLITITGSGLNGVSPQGDDAAISFSGLSVSPTSVSFRMLVSRQAALGMHSLTLRNAAGSASVTFEVQEEVQYVVAPVPLAVPPDGSTRQYRIDASVADVQPLTLAVSSSNTSVVQPVATSVSLPAGATSATGTVRGLAVGIARLRFSSPDLIEPIDVAVEVTPDFATGQQARSSALGLVKGDPTAPGVNVPSTAYSSAVGIVKGDPTAPGINVPSTTYSPALGLNRSN